MDTGIKKRIGILYNFDSNWMGGVIYIQNLIETLNYLDDDEKPEVILFYRKDLKSYVEEINYPFLFPIEWKFISVYKGFISSWLKGRNLFIDKIINEYNLEGIYPVQDFPVKGNPGVKLVSWFADLQHKYYPEFFTTRKIIERDARIWFIFRNCKDLVVSSQVVADDFKRFFKIRKTIRIHIYHFVSVIKSMGNLNIEELRNKFRLPTRYYIVSNQFHKHKNHRVLFETLALLNKEGVRVHLAITGKFPSASNSKYLEDLLIIINDNNLGAQISFLGVISRNEQLLLMKNSQAVLQPSLFEGWSTVIEDAKSLQVPVIAANLPVNIEQLGSKGVFFNPHDPSELAKIILNFPERNIAVNLYEDYEKRVKIAARSFLQIIYK